ncbi:NucA/NucB deoxyribonuclease domain-containing protein [Yinghuangia sp. ASG 101]|uniref:NucA/NucB deoxyribonuclease domain-containing protein n=1 Tax=Yinghuangia sp. ASG 101 TaxID=2896848 RepID=UPI001E64C2E2|nr:NucA/NucB deoxyribonuclease domain-containing protein [Yinghuangia sp. ASG 101]UGQ12048.1 NucA/NucB deoxyribonuclease domain-containing protein [Yinghuangia sp. ASG 101]
MPATTSTPAADPTSPPGDAQPQVPAVPSQDASSSTGDRTATVLKEVSADSSQLPVGATDAASASRLETPEQIQRRAELSLKDSQRMQAAAHPGMQAAGNTTPDPSFADCKASSDAATAWGMVVSHRFYCHTKNYSLETWECDGPCPEGEAPCVPPQCIVAGTDFFRLTTIGRITYDAQRLVTFTINLTDWRSQGVTADARVMTIGIDCTAPSGDCGPGPNNGRSAPVSAWKTAGVTYAEFNVPVLPGSGDNGESIYSFNGNLSVAGFRPRESPKFAENGFRCDNATYAGPASGCVFHNVTEIFHIDRGDVTVQEAAQHIWDALNAPHLTAPHAMFKNIPGKLGSGNPLHRVGDPQQKNNRTTSTGTCRRFWSVPGRSYARNAQGQYVYDCDEYPFASTKEGARNAGLNYSVRVIDKDDNQKAGREYLEGNFYRGNRILRGDAFYVNVHGQPVAPVPLVPIPNGNDNCQIFSSTQTGSYSVCGVILDKYLQLGGPSSIGYPIGDFDLTPDDSGQFQHFSHASSIYWSPATGTHQIGGDIRSKWAVQGSEAGPLGYPTTDELATPDGTGRYNHFKMRDGGDASIYWTLSLGAHSIQGDIRSKWAEKGWELGIGYPTTDETATPDGVGRYNHFTNNASIYWTPNTGAHSVQGDIRGRWAASGWELGIGYPTTDETATPDGVGRYNHFTNDTSIYWTPNTGAHAIRGVTRAKWASLGWERYGYPTEDEVALRVQVAQGPPFVYFTYHQRFQTLGTTGDTAIITRWASDTGQAAGPFELHGANYLATVTHWASRGFDASWIALTLASDEMTNPDGRGRYNNFANVRTGGGAWGTAVWTPQYGAYVVDGAWGVWRDTGFERGTLGYPTSGEYRVENIPAGRTGVVQYFERGCVYAVRGTNGQLTSYNNAPLSSSYCARP